MSKTINSFYTDSSLNKQILQKRIENQHRKDIHKTYEKTKSDLKTVLLQLHQVQIQKLNNNLTKKDLANRKNEEKIMNAAAQKIQACVRGFLIRKKYEGFIISFSKSLFYNRLDSLKETEQYCFLNVGIMVHNAAVKLQRFCKRALFKRKIRRIYQTYLVYLETLRAPLYEYIGKVIICFYNKDILLNKKNERIRSAKLIKIREKLALATIKACLNRRKLKLKMIKYKIKRYKKLQKFAQKLAQTTKKNPSEIEDKKSDLMNSAFISPVSPVSIDLDSPSLVPLRLDSPSLAPLNSLLIPNTFTLSASLDPENHSNNLASTAPIIIKNIKEDNFSYNDLDLSISEPYNQYIQRKNKIRKGFSSLGIQKSKNKSITPILYQKEIETRPGTHHYDRTTSSISRMLESVPSRTSPKINKSIKIRTQSAIPKPKTVLTYNYLNQTVCSKLRSEFEIESENFKEVGYKNNKKYTQNKIFQPTITYLQKKTEKKHPVLKPTKKIVRKNEILIPSVENQSFRLKISNFRKRPKNESPKSNKSCSLRSKTDVGVRKNSEFSPLTLTFEAALPEYSEYLTSVLRPLYIHLRPRTVNKLT